MAGETTNPGYIEAQAYATAPSGNAPDQAHQEHGRGVNSYNLEQAGEAAKLAGVIDVNSSAPTPSATIDSSGNVLIGKTSPDISVAGLEILPAGVMAVSRDSSVPMVVNRITDDGDLIQLRQDDVAEGAIGVSGNNVSLNSTSGAVAIKTIGSERARVDSSGNLLVGKTTASLSTAGFEAQQSGVLLGTRSAGRCMLLNRLVDDGTIIDFMQNDSIEGSISITGSTTTYGTTSDYRLKENVTPLTGATDRLKQLPVKIFNFIASPDRTVDGFLAHEVQAVVPEAVTGVKNGMEDHEVLISPAVYDEDGLEVTPAVYETETRPAYQQIDQSKLVPLLVATIQELEARITALEA